MLQKTTVTPTMGTTHGMRCHIRLERMAQALLLKGFDFGLLRSTFPDCILLHWLHPATSEKQLTN